MYIKKLEIFSFGCLENKTLEFENGFNLIYGKNESGKSTIFAFVIYVFYGTKIKKKPGVLPFKEQYTPWNGKPMHGRITFEHNNHTYVLERLVAHGKSTEKLYSLSTGEEIKDREILSSPGEYFFGVGAESFFASAFYSGDNSGVSFPNNEELITKLTNSVENSSTEVSYNKIVDTIDDEIANLASPRRKNAVIPLTEEKLRSKKSELFQFLAQNSESQKAFEENQNCKEDIEKYRSQISALKEENRVLEGGDAAVSEKSIFRYFFAVLLALCLILYFLKKQMFFLLFSGVILLVWLSLELRRLVIKRSRKEAIYTKFFTMQRNNDKIVVLTEKIAELKECVVRNEEHFASNAQNNLVIETIKLEVESLEAELADFKKQVKALEIAKLAVTNAYNTYKELFVPKLSQLSGHILSEFTSGKYTTALVDDSLKMAIEDDSGYKNAVSLSRGTTYQAGLSLHLALSDILLSEKGTPWFLDDAFAFYDDDRVNSAMKHLVSLSADRQIFFSTCRKNEADILKNKNINFINLIV